MNPPNIVLHKPKVYVKRSQPEIPQVVKIENDTENLSHKTLGKAIGLKIQQGRINKGIKTQKDLAKLINEKDISQYESGKVIPSVKVMQKLRSVLGINLRT